MKRLIVLGLLLVSTAVLAQPQPVPAPAPPQAAPVDPAADAKHHFEQGVALLQAGNNAAALAEFEASYKLAPVAAVLRNIAVAQQALFMYAEAVETLQKYLESPDLTEQERTEVMQVINGLNSTLTDYTLTVEPAGATITLDGRDMGKAPRTKPLRLQTGDHTIEVSADGYKPSKQKIAVVGGAPPQVLPAIKLVAIPHTARVRIKASADGAAVEIDGKPGGLAPVEVELKEGGHTLEVSATGYKTYRTELVVAAGQDRDITAPLERQKRWYQNWKVMTAIGATAGVLILGLAINYGTTEDPVTGTLQPGVGTVE